MCSDTRIASNIEVLNAFVREAAKAGATYIQTPEMTGILQKKRRALFEEITDQDNDRLVAHAAFLAAELKIWLHIGSHAVQIGPELAANRAFLFSPAGELVTTYDKIHMFDVDLPNGETWRESKVYKSGSSCVIANLDWARLGVSICYDMRFPSLYRSQAQRGVGILTAPAAFTRQTGQAHWHILLRARAIENGAFMIAAAQGGDHEDGRSTFGHSLIINPWGDIIAELPSEEPGVIFADLDLSLVEEARHRIPNLRNERDFKIEENGLNVGDVA